MELRDGSAESSSKTRAIGLQSKNVKLAEWWRGESGLRHSPLASFYERLDNSQAAVNRAILLLLLFPSVVNTKIDYRR